MREGDPADAFYVVRAGGVALVTEVPGPRRGDDRDAAARRPARLVLARASRIATGSGRARTARRACSHSTGSACAASARPTRRSATRCSSCWQACSPSGCATRGCGCSTSTAAMLDGTALMPAPVARRRAAARDARHVDAAARTAGRRSPRASSRCCTRSAPARRRSRSARSTTASSTRSAPSARSPARCARPTRSACAARSGTRGRSRRPAGAPVVIVAGGIGLAPLRPVVRALGDRALLLYGARSPRELLYAEELAGWGAQVDRRRAGGGLGRARRRGHEADRARRFRPGDGGRHGLRPGRDDALRRRVADRARHAGRRRSGSRSSAA